jgi:ferredoxin
VRQCAHGVYDKKSPLRPVIIYTDGCVDRCHGCGNLCPSGSITYQNDDTGWTPPLGQQAATPDTDRKQQSGQHYKSMLIFESDRISAGSDSSTTAAAESTRVAEAMEKLQTCAGPIDFQRFKFTDTPQEFFINPAVNQRLVDEGMEALPLVVVDGRIVMSKRYPRNDELAKLLGVNCDCL